MKHRVSMFLKLAIASLLLAGAGPGAARAAQSQPLKVLLLASGGYHDYKTLVPFLSSNLTRRINIEVDSKWGLDTLKNPDFAKEYDAVIYDVCDDEAPDEAIANALRATRAGKPTVMIHCAVHAFRRSPKIAEWEECCGMRSKVHDPYQKFSVQKLDETSPITKSFPDGWTTPGDELYQTISIQPEAHPLLKVKSPRDGREHVVCWTWRYGQGRVFATTLGHDMKTTTAPEYLDMVANGLLWACGKLEPNGAPAEGYGKR